MLAVLFARSDRGQTSEGMRKEHKPNADGQDATLSRSAPASPNGAGTGTPPDALTLKRQGVYLMAMTSATPGTPLIRAGQMLDFIWHEILQRDITDLPPVTIVMSDAVNEVCEGSAIDHDRHRIFISANRLRRGAQPTTQALLHAAAHMLAHARGIQDTSRNGRYHNTEFLKLGIEVGLAYPYQRPQPARAGYAAMAISDATKFSLKPVLDRLTVTLARFQGDDESPPPRGTGGGAYLKATCGCSPPKIIRVAPGTLNQAGGIRCGSCKQPFRLA